MQYRCQSLLSSALKENKKGGLAPASKYKERDIVMGTSINQKRDIYRLDGGGFS